MSWSFQTDPDYDRVITCEKWSSGLEVGGR